MKEANCIFWKKVANAPPRLFSGTTNLTRDAAAFSFSFSLMRRTELIFFFSETWL